MWQLCINPSRCLQAWPLPRAFGCGCFPLLAVMPKAEYCHAVPWHGTWATRESGAGVSPAAQGHLPSSGSRGCSSHDSPLPLCSPELSAQAQPSPSATGEGEMPAEAGAGSVINGSKSGSPQLPCSLQASDSLNSAFFFFWHFSAAVTVAAFCWRAFLFSSHSTAKSRTTLVRTVLRNLQLLLTGKLL